MAERAAETGANEYCKRQRAACMANAAVQRPRQTAQQNILRNCAGYGRTVGRYMPAGGKGGTDMECSGINCPMQYCPYATKVPYTNAACIRAMSDEELAEFLCHFKDCAGDCLIGKGVKDCSGICATRRTLKMWLQQPAKEDT